MPCVHLLERAAAQIETKNVRITILNRKYKAIIVKVYDFA